MPAIQVKDGRVEVKSRVETNGIAFDDFRTIKPGESFEGVSYDRLVKMGTGFFELENVQAKDTK